MVVAIPGAGAGKTSLLDVLAGRLKQTSGSVLVNERLRTSQFASLAAYVAQAGALPSLHCSPVNNARSL